MDNDIWTKGEIEIMEAVDFNSPSLLDDLAEQCQTRLGQDFSAVKIYLAYLHLEDYISDGDKVVVEVSCDPSDWEGGEANADGRGTYLGQFYIGPDAVAHSWEFRYDSKRYRYTHQIESAIREDIIRFILNPTIGDRSVIRDKIYKLFSEIVKTIPFRYIGYAQGLE